MICNDAYCLGHTYLICIAGIACSVVNCGQGTCKASNASLLGFECLCKSGWQKIQIGPLAFPSCIIPNCECFLLYIYNFLFQEYVDMVDFCKTSLKTFETSGV